MQTIVRFGLFELDMEARQLYRGGVRVRLARQPYELLRALVEEPGKTVSRETLQQRLWPPDTFVDYEQGLNKAVRKLREALGDSAESPRYIETLQKTGYRFIAPVDVTAESPPRSETAPAFAQPAGYAVPEPGATVVQHLPGESIADSSRTLRRVLAWLLAVLALLAVVDALRRHPLRSEASPHVRTLAVLPLENLSGDPGQDFLADGMTDDLTTMLARDSTLHVLSRTSAMQFKGTHRALPEIARALGADAIVEGSVAREGTRMHMTLQLISADTDAHLWAESYDRPLSESGMLPDEGARAIAQRLGSASPTQAAVRYVSPEAHEAYMRGEYLWPTERMEESGAYFQKATELQPDYSEAWAGLANYYGEGIAAGFLDPRIYDPLLEKAAERAVALDPNLALAHQAMGGADLIARWDLADADRETQLAIRLNPNDAKSYYLRSNVLLAMNRIPEAIETARKGMEVNPFEVRTALADMYIAARRFDDAIAEVHLRMETAPNDPILIADEQLAWVSKGNYAEAVKAEMKLLQLRGRSADASHLQRVYEAGGGRGFVEWELHRSLERSRKQYVSPIELASYYSQLGDREKTLEMLEEGYRQHQIGFLWIEGDPAYDALHEEPRYRALVAKLPKA